MKRLTIDEDYLHNIMLELLRTPSPSGRTDVVMQIIGDHLDALGLPVQITRRGVLRATIEGDRRDSSRAVVVHADTIGAMVKRLKPNGRLEVVPIGTHSARFAEGAHVTVFPDDLNLFFTGTVLPLMSSGHNFGEAVDTQGIGWHQVEIRLDEKAHSAADVAALGIQVGDFVALDAAPQVTPGGFVKSRHLDDKAGLAACMTAVKALADSGVPLPVTAHLLVTIGEEVGMGATHGLDDTVAELVAVDNAVVADGQESREDTVNIAMLDSTGPFDYHLTRRLIGLCRDYELPYRRDIYRFYRSDAAPAIESGLECRTALLGFGVESSHGHERTHLDGLRYLTELLTLYLQSPLTFEEWDKSATGTLEDFPSHSVQPAEPEPEHYADGRHG
ncbi:MAG TPA: osmoprotectant NAGGN system M42 family peptidase [Jiangellaceae bacterium]|nr:osmoprotectant NAGGN system M42 family peptidase [Jiangellaceae bacterium]